MSSLDELCDDILLMIFEDYLDLQSLLRTQVVCNRFNQLVEQIFNKKRSLVLTDRTKRIDYLIDEDLDNYSLLSVQQLCCVRNGLWYRTSRGLRLLTSVDIMMFALRYYKNLKALCVVINEPGSLEALLDLIALNCSSDLEKLFIVNINGKKLTISCKQMKNFCNKFKRLTHFLIHTDWLYGSEEAFAELLKTCTQMTSLKVNTRSIFDESVRPLGQTAGQSITHNSFQFNGFCLTETGHHLTAMDVSNAVLSNEVIVKIANNESLKQLRHLGVQRLVPTAMQSICNHIKDLESLSVSMDDDLNPSDTKDFISFIGQLNCLKKLSISWFGRQDLRNPDLDEYSIKGLENCPNLKTLVIKEALLKEESIRAMAKHLQSLTRLHIIDCTLTNQTFNQIIRFVSLKQLFIVNSFTETFVEFDINPSNESLIDQIISRCYQLYLIESPGPEHLHVPLNFHQHNYLLNLANHELPMDEDEEDEPIGLFAIEANALGNPFEEDIPLDFLHGVDYLMY